MMYLDESFARCGLNERIWTGLASIPPCLNSRIAERISIEFYTGDLYEKLSRNFNCHLNRKYLTMNLHQTPKCVIAGSLNIHRREVFRTKIVEKNEAHIFLSDTFSL